MIKTFLAATWLAAAATTAFADDLPNPASGYLCCNMRTDGSWISDSNYMENGKRVIPAGTPMKVTGYGRQRVIVEIEGKEMKIGNDYSRDLNLPTFARRYLVTEDPRKKIATYPPAIRKAIEHAQVMPGMTREQVLMAVGPPISSETPNLDGKVWRFWIGSFSEFQVVFENDVVKQIDTDPQTRNLVVAD